MNGCAGPTPIPRNRLTTEALAAAITEAVTTPGYREKSRSIAHRISGKDGAAGVLAWLDTMVDHKC